MDVIAAPVRRPYRPRVPEPFRNPGRRFALPWAVTLRPDRPKSKNSNVCTVLQIETGERQRLRGTLDNLAPFSSYRLHDKA